MKSLTSFYTTTGPLETDAKLLPVSKPTLALHRAGESANGSKAPFRTSANHFPSAPNSGHSQSPSARLKGANGGNQRPIRPCRLP
jgi:hypothetical protein